MKAFTGACTGIGFRTQPFVSPLTYPLSSSIRYFSITRSITTPSSLTHNDFTIQFILTHLIPPSDPEPEERRPDQHVCTAMAFINFSSILELQKLKSGRIVVHTLIFNLLILRCGFESDRGGVLKLQGLAACTCTEVIWH